MLAGETLSGYTNLFSPNDYKMKDKIIYKYFKDKYARRRKFRVQKIGEIINYLLDEINHESINKTYKYLNYVEHLLILASIITGCISISAFASLVCVAITSSAVGIDICAITGGIKKYKSIIKKNKKR